MYDLLKALVGSNVSTIFILFGLGLVVIGLIGGISGKIELDKVGRFASVMVGSLLVAVGLWMVLPGSFVENVKVSWASHPSILQCPAEVQISGIIAANGPGSVAYEFQFGDKTNDGQQVLEFEKAGTKVVKGKWSVSETSTNVNAKLRVLWQRQVIDAETDNAISVTCDHRPSTKPSSPEPSTTAQSQSSCPLKPRTGQQPGRGVNCKTINNRTTEPVVRLICADADLADLDGRMSKIYVEKLNGAEDKVAVVKEQIRWNSRRNETCKIPLQGDQDARLLACAKPCLLKMMKDRSAELSR